jgi:hypothetical protein
MMIEHRWHERASVNLDVDAVLGVQKTERWIVTNISPQGVFLQTGGERLPKGCVVDLSFAVPAERKLTRVEVRGLVVHSCDRGAGLMFFGLQQKLYAMVTGMMEAA